MKKYVSLIIIFLILSHLSHSQAKIDRKALVERHTIINTKFDSLSSLSVGNGAFAFTVDVTGLQSFPDAYAKGVPLGTQSEWGWHSFPNTANHKFEDALKSYQLHGRDVQYAVQWNSPPEHKNASDYFRQNLHRLQLANIGLEIIKKDGTLYTIKDLTDIRQTLNMWTGDIHSSFKVEQVLVTVITYGSQDSDGLAVKIVSDLVQQNRLKVRVRLPYPTGDWADMGNNWASEEKHTSNIITNTASSAIIEHVLDTTRYYISTSWKGQGKISTTSPHYFLITPGKASVF